MAKASSFGLMKALMMETFIRTIFMVKESTNGLMEESTMGNGSITRWKEKELSHGVMEEDMWANIKTIRRMVTVPSNGQMAESTLESGVRASNMEKVFTSRMARSDKASGRWAKELNGLKMETLERIEQ